MSKPDGRVMLALRRMTPEPVKRVVRLARLAVMPVPPRAPQLPAEAIESCQFLPSRTAMLDRLTKNAVMAELGSLRGDFSREILQRCDPVRLHLIDLDFSQLRSEVQQHPAVTLHKGLTAEILAGFQDGHFDFIYVDADHSYEAVVSDIAAAVPKLKPGGVIAFNDFGRIVRPGFGVFGVHQAVCEFIAAKRWAVIFFCFDGEALYDIALRKPG